MVTAAANFMSTVAAGCTAVQALMGAAPLVAPAARRVSIWLAHVPDRADFILSNHLFLCFYLGSLLQMASGSCQLPVADRALDSSAVGDVTLP